MARTTRAKRPVVSELTQFSGAPFAAEACGCAGSCGTWRVIQSGALVCITSGQGVAEAIATALGKSLNS